MDIPGEWVVGAAGVAGAAVTTIWAHMRKQVHDIGARLNAVEDARAADAEADAAARQAAADARLADAKQHAAEHRELTVLVTKTMASHTAVLRELVKCLGTRPCMGQDAPAPAPDPLPTVDTEILTRKPHP